MNLILSNSPIASAEVYRAISERILRGECDSFILVVPTRRKASVLRRAWMRESDLHAAPAMPVFTLGDLYSCIAKESLPPRYVIDEEIQYMLLERTARHANLKYFTKRQQTLPEGTLRTILNTIMKLKEGGVSPADLRQTVAEQERGNNGKTEDIIALYEGYEEQIKKKFNDQPGILLELNKEIAEKGLSPSFNTAFPRWRSTTQKPMIMIEGFNEFRPPECALLTALARLPETIVSISFDYATGNGALFGHLEEHIARLERHGFPYRTSIDESDNTWRGMLQTKFFAEKPSSPVPANDVTIIHAETREREVETITRIVKQFALEKPERDLSKICIVTRMPGNYTSLFRESFADAGVPANVSERFALAQSGVVVAFLALLDLPLQNFRRRDVARVFTSPYFTLRNQYRNHEPVDGGNLIAVAEHLRIEGGIEIWRERIKHRLVYLNNASETEDISIEEIENEITADNRALSDIRALESCMRDLSHPDSPREFQKRFENFFVNAETQQNIFTGWFDDPAGSFAYRERESRAFTMLVEIIKSVCNVLALAHPSGEPAPVKFIDFARLVRAAITNARFNVRQEFGKGVLITTPEETRGLDIDVMFIAGLTEGEFPLPYAPEIFLSGQYQTSRTRHAQDERFLFYQAASNWNERLYLSAPARNESGREFVRSSFLEEIRRQFQCAEYQPVENRMYSKKQFLGVVGDTCAASGGERIPKELSLPTFQECCEAIYAGVRAESSRHGTHALPEYEGLLRDVSDTQHALLDRYRTAVFSASRLTTYALCPFRFFTEQALRVTAPFIPEDGLSPIERGALLHRILFMFYTGIRERDGKFPQDMNDEELAAAKRTLRALAFDEIERLGVEHPFWKLDIERYFGFDSPACILDNFIEHEHALGDLRVRPTFFEVSFGLHGAARGHFDERLTSDNPISFGAWSLRGKIDRIDTSEEDWTILDYKTGTPPGRADINAGLNMQLPLYVRAGETLRQTADNTNLQQRISAGIYYTVNAQNKGWDMAFGVADKSRETIATKKTGQRYSTSHDAMNEIINASIASANSYIAGMTTGHFQLAQPDRRQTACRSCPYDTACRVMDDPGAPVIEPGKTEIAA